MTNPVPPKSQAQQQLEANPELIAEMERVFADPSIRVRRGRPRRKSLSPDGESDE